MSLHQGNINILLETLKNEKYDWQINVNLKVVTILDGIYNIQSMVVFFASGTESLQKKSLDTKPMF